MEGLGIGVEALADLNRGRGWPCPPPPNFQKKLQVNNGYFMVKFDLHSDKETVTRDGPWMFFDHYLCVAHWSPEFASPNARFQKTMVLVRFPGLILLYYDENVWAWPQSLVNLSMWIKTLYVWNVVILPVFVSRLTFPNPLCGKSNSKTTGIVSNMKVST